MPQSETIETRRKRLLWRATHRGIREMDILVGGYAIAHINAMSSGDLDQLEAIIALPDQQMLAWATQQEETPPQHQSAMLSAILAFRP
ncbi:succinate dehydrogenase assembly factor 2 [Aestuariivirga sp.]|uniref:FAD assembly factor SdhE n=1 Tax=Aestuariivirga sp. TaxID=2650926 RepID=UPI0039E3242C